METSFVDRAIDLLEQIDGSREKKEWCHRYSVYFSDSEQKELCRNIHEFVDGAYTEGLIISNYQNVIRRWRLEEQNIETADSIWLETQPYLCVLASIAWHFRRDHFCEGSLISQSIANGILLRLFQRLKLLSPTASPATTLQNLYRCRCESIPEEPGVYWVLAPKGMPIRFTEQVYNRSALPYPVEILAQKYMDLADKEILYIGKADGKKGLRQRLRQYMDHGWKNASNHKGGRAVWQIEDAGSLLLAYEVCENAGVREKQLLAEYKAKNGNYPLANWRG